MKKVVVLMMLIMGGIMVTSRSEAQISINISIGDQPDWAPVGYDHTQYYYFPDMDMYYDVAVHQFVYLQNRHWVHSAVLPVAYRRYDLYKVHKVMINERNAYINHARDRQLYARFKGWYNDQSTIRASRDTRYVNNRGNWNDNRFDKTHHAIEIHHAPQIRTRH